MTKAEIDLMFDNSQRVLFELGEEVARLKEGPHKDKPFVQSKASQLTTLISLHDNTREIIESFYNALRLSAVVHGIKDAKILKYETGLSWEKINDFTGILTPSKTEQELDAKIRAHVKELNALDGRA